MQSTLEKKGIERRKVEILRNDYEIDNQYSFEHDDALTHEDEAHPMGKGTGEGGHGYTLPNPNLSPYIIDRSNFNTQDGGGSYDKYGRNGVGGRYKLQGINIYGPNNEYGRESVEVDMNIIGQYLVS